MNRSTIGMAALAAGMTVCGAAGTAWAAPSDATLEVYAATVQRTDPFFAERIDLVEGASLAAGGSIVLNTANASYGSSVRVSYDVETVGTTRTMRLTYSALGEGFATSAAYDALGDLPDNGSYGLGFHFGFFEDTMETADRERTWSTSLGAGGELFDVLPHRPWGEFDDDFFDGMVYLDQEPGSDPGFFGAPGHPVDTFIFEMTYRIVPAPGAAAVLALGGLAAARRR